MGEPAGNKRSGPLGPKDAEVIADAVAKGIARSKKSPTWLAYVAVIILVILIANVVVLARGWFVHPAQNVWINGRFPVEENASFANANFLLAKGDPLLSWVSASDVNTIEVSSVAGSPFGIVFLANPEACHNLAVALKTHCEPDGSIRIGKGNAVELEFSQPVTLTISSVPGYSIVGLKLYEERDRDTDGGTTARLWLGASPRQEKGQQSREARETGGPLVVADVYNPEGQVMVTVGGKLIETLQVVPQSSLTDGESRVVLLTVMNSSETAVLGEAADGWIELHSPDTEIDLTARTERLNSLVISGGRGYLQIDHRADSVALSEGQLLVLGLEPNERLEEVGVSALWVLNDRYIVGYSEGLPLGALGWLPGISAWTVMRNGTEELLPRWIDTWPDPWREVSFALAGVLFLLIPGLLRRWGLPI